MSSSVDEPEEVHEDPIQESVETNPELYRSLISGTLIAYLVLFALGGIMFLMNVMLIPGILNAGIGFIIVALTHLACSWQVVKTDEFAGAYFYERALVLLKAGPHFLPFGLIQTKRIPRGRKQFQAPAESDKIFYGTDIETVPEGMARAIRLTTRGPKEGENQALDKQMVLEWTWYVEYQINDFFRFISVVDSFENAAKMMRDIGDTLLAEYVISHTANGVLENLANFNERFDNQFRKETREWGMEIYAAKTMQPNVGHAVAQALRNVPAAELNKRTTVITAEGEAKRLELEGSGHAAAKKADLLAEAEGREAFLNAEAVGLKAKKEALGVSGETLVAAEAMANALSGSNSKVILGTGGVTDVLGMVVAGAEVLKGKEEPKK